MILINVKLNAKTGQLSEFKKLLIETMVASQAEDGCLEYQFTQDLQQENKFYLLELWQDSAALESHLKGAGFSQFISRLPDLGEVTSSIAQQGELLPYQVQR